jgi:dihydroorotate dehydrogenase
MLFINPPFGNYLNIKNTIPIRGSFTLYERKGLVVNIFKSLRYSFFCGGWVNKIGLRNKGIDYAIKTYQKGEIISIAILKESDINTLIEKIPDNMDIEINVSCPNTDKSLINDGLSRFINDKRDWCIVKLSPVCDNRLIDKYYKEGFRQFHCSNTLPIRYGGLSGPSLIPYTTRIVKYIKTAYPDTIVIAGGGVRNVRQANKYLDLGADHISASTLFFNPILSWVFLRDFLPKKSL